jgi:hypothetical protein
LARPGRTGLQSARRDRREDHLPGFVGRVDSDAFFRGQPEELMQHLTAPATLASFTVAEGAGAQCQVGAERLLEPGCSTGSTKPWPDPGPGPHPVGHNQPVTGVSERTNSRRKRD